MAFLNNWDLKDSNTAIYAARAGARTSGPRNIYLVSDVGSSFGPPALTLPSSKGDIDGYARSCFITKVTSEHVSFCSPHLPPLFTALAVPYFIGRARMLSIGRNIPREDVQWIAGLLAQVRPWQIRRALESAGYSPREAEKLEIVIDRRIAQLSEL
jgi:hypothetical protein